MIREERAKYLSQLIIPDLFDNSHASCELRMKQEEALYETIAELMQEPCEDCISRRAVLDALDKHKYSNVFCEEHHIDWSINLGMAHIVVNKLKPVIPQPKIGHVISDEDGNIKCSNCGSHDCWGNYCSECGAKMEVEK